MSFDSLGLSETTLQTIIAVGYKEPTPIQAEAIPVVIEGRDLFGCAQTGTGKTASFVLPILDLLSKGRARARLPRALVLVPTRELAQQVLESFETLGKNHKLKLAALIGGESMMDQEKKMAQGVDIIVATPGRLMDILSRGKILMTGIQHLILDEADRMLDMGFIPDVDKILTYIPKKHQTLFFSATASPDIIKLTKNYLNNPKEISVAPRSSASVMIEQFSVPTTLKQKRNVLRALIQEQNIQSAIIFCNRKIEVNVLTASLKRHKFSAALMHGDLPQSERTKTLELFKQKQIQFLIASDVAARGIDVDDLPCVINFDVPINAEEYVHRIGRTGRAGRSGVAYTLVIDKDKKQLKAIETLMQSPLKTYEVSIKLSEAKAEVKTTPKGPSTQEVKALPVPEVKKVPHARKERVTPQKESSNGVKNIPRQKKETLPVYGFGTETPAFFHLQWGELTISTS